LKTDKLTGVGPRGWVTKAGAVVAFLWIMAVFAGYYAVHKPLSPQDIKAIERVAALALSGWSGSGVAPSVWAVAVAAWMFLAAFFMGIFLLRRFFPSCINSSWDYWTHGAPLGLGTLSIIIFLLGMLGTLHTWIFVTILSATTLIFIKPSNLVYFRDSISTAASAARIWDRWTRLLIGFVALSMLVALFSALAPPTAWDALVYHLFQAKIYVNAHRIAPGLDITHIYFPPLTEMLFTGAMLLGSEIAPALFSFIFYCLMLLALYRYSSTVFSGNYRWLPICLIVSSPSLVYLAGKPYVEWGLLLYIFLAFWQMERWSDSHNRGHLALSGVYAGLAMGVKYTASPMVLALGIILLWRLPHPFDQLRTAPNLLPAERGNLGQLSLGEGGGEGDRQPAWTTSYNNRQILTSAVLWALVALAVASPWYIKNLLFTGNPVYPFVFDGWNWDGWRAEWFSRPGTGLLGEPARLLTLPWEMTVLGQEGSVYYDATIGLLYLALLPLVFLVGWDSRVKAWVFIAAMGYAVWAVGVAQSSLLLQTRLMYPVFPFLALIVTHSLAGLRSWGHGPFDLGWVVRCLVGLALALTALGYMVRLVSHTSVPYLVGAQSKEEYLKANLGGYYLAMEEAKNRLSKEDKLLLLWEPRGYLCPVECQPDSLLYNWRYALHKHGSNEAVLKRWQEEGYTHLLLNNNGVVHFSTPPQQELEEEHLSALIDLEKEGLETIWGEGLTALSRGEADVSIEDTRLVGKDYGYTIYKLKY